MLMMLIVCVDEIKNNHSSIKLFSRIGLTLPLCLRVFVRECLCDVVVFFLRVCCCCFFFFLTATQNEINSSFLHKIQHNTMVNAHLNVGHTHSHRIETHSLTHTLGRWMKWPIVLCVIVYCLYVFKSEHTKQM